MINFDDSWSLIDRISHLQKRILLNSVIYYVHDMSFISDDFYDSMCNQLVKLQKEYGDKFVDDSRYGYAFFDFDGSTGFHLYGRLSREDKDIIKEICLWKLQKNF